MRRYAREVDAKRATGHFDKAPSYFHFGAKPKEVRCFLTELATPRRIQYSKGCLEHVCIFLADRNINVCGSFGTLE